MTPSFDGPFNDFGEVALALWLLVVGVNAER
jgi:hypothetical protein